MVQKFNKIILNTLWQEGPVRSHSNIFIATFNLTWQATDTVLKCLPLIKQLCYFISVLKVLIICSIILSLTLLTLCESSTVTVRVLISLPSSKHLTSCWLPSVRYKLMISHYEKCLSWGVKLKGWGGLMTRYHFFFTCSDMQICWYVPSSLLGCNFLL